VINTVASRTLMAGFLQGIPLLGMEQVKLAGAEIRENLKPSLTGRRRRGRSPFSSIALIDVAIAVAIAAVVLIFTVGFWREMHQ
jgi:hypothetical protein